jgi:transcriptional regulator with XRE-family HTH domain
MPLSPLERKSKLILGQILQRDIAEKLGLSEIQVSAVVRGERRSARVEQAVADAIGMPVEEVFPPTSAAITVDDTSAEPADQSAVSGQSGNPV